jgi:hypothetical protein
MGNGTSLRQQSGQNARLTTTIYLVQMLRINGVNTSNPSNNFMTYAREKNVSTFSFSECVVYTIKLST